MASEQIMNEAITKAVAEATRVAIQAMAAATVEWPQNMAGPKLGTPAMKQTMFNWESEDKYSKLKTFKLEVNNILSTYNTPQIEQLVMVKNWFGRKGLQFLETLTSEEKITCDTLDRLLKTLTSKYRPQFNERIKLLQFRKLYRNDGENAEEWMGRLRCAAAECNYQELDK